MARALLSRRVCRGGLACCTEASHDCARCMRQTQICALAPIRIGAPGALRLNLGGAPAHPRATGLMQRGAHSPMRARARGGFIGT